MSEYYNYPAKKRINFESVICFNFNKGMDNGSKTWILRNTSK